MNEVINEVLDGIVALAVAILTPMAVKAISRWRQKHEKHLISEVVWTVVRAVEQAVLKEGVKMDNLAKFEAAKEKIQKALPWLPVETIETEIRAAVKGMNDHMG